MTTKRDDISDDSFYVFLGHVFRQAEELLGRTLTLKEIAQCDDYLPEMRHDFTEGQTARHVARNLLTALWVY